MARIILTAEHDKVIAEIIKSSPATLTWDEVICEAEKIFGYKWTRQALHGRKDVYEAFEGRRDGKAKRLSPAQSVGIVERVTVLEAEVKRLKARLANYDELFVAYEYNAANLLISIPMERLAEPIPEIDRRGSHIDPKIKFVKRENK